MKYPNKSGKRILGGAVRRTCGLLVLLFFSCGIEDYIYLKPVETAYAEDISRGRFIIPDNNGNVYFRSYTIFYRIYISDISLASVTTGSERASINPALESHYSTLNPYTTNDKVSPNAIGSVFSSLRYYSLYVTLDRTNDIALYQLLGNQPYGAIPAADSPGGAGSTVHLDFTGLSSEPVMKLDHDPAASAFYLFRSRDFTALPDRFFKNTNGTGKITDAGSIGTMVNADVERNANNNPAITPKYTYVSMYVLASGIDSNYTVIYSRPKHIGIFRLPSIP
ncbi:MAG: hypothetical protein LBO65_06345 [Spirochaetaceae bacterium]|nr:hypothetical protein [Spirochaetaceae bacterium]